MLYEMVAGHRPYAQHEKDSRRLEHAIKTNERREPLPESCPPAARGHHQQAARVPARAPVSECGRHPGGPGGVPFRARAGGPLAIRGAADHDDCPARAARRDRSPAAAADRAIAIGHGAGHGSAAAHGCDAGAPHATAAALAATADAAVRRSRIRFLIRLRGAGSPCAVLRGWRRCSPSWPCSRSRAPPGWPPSGSGRR